MVIMKKNNWHGQNQGKVFEKKIIAMLQNQNLEYKKEIVAHSKRTSKRNSGEFDLIVNGDTCLELKTTQKKSLSFSLNEKKSADIKFHQLAALYKEFFTNGKKAGLLLEYRGIGIYYVDIKNFLVWVSDTSKKSITHAVASEIGVKVECIKDIWSES